MTGKAERWQSVLSALWARADHPATPPAEAELARSKALELAGKYSIGIPSGIPSGELPGNDPGYASQCQCGMANQLDPGGAYGPGLHGWSVQMQTDVVRCPEHGPEYGPAGDPGIMDLVAENFANLYL
jgi:hypothetical protein